MTWPRLRVVRLLPELDFGGVESRVVLQSGLYTRTAFDLRVCAFHKAGAAAEAVRANDVAVDVLGVSPAVRNARAPGALLRYLQRMRPDILHASIAEANFHALLVAGLAKVPVVIAEETGMPSHGALARLAFSWLYRRASTVVGVTQAVCDYVRDMDRAPAERVRLVYNCANPKYFPEARRQPTPDVPRRLLAVGRLVEVKNHERLIEAFHGVVRTLPDARLSIAGEGPLRPQLERRIRELGLQDHVELLGFQGDVRELLATSRGFVLPSISEGCSISLIEAMATGVVVAGSRVPGIVEVMGDSLAREWTAPVHDVEAWTELLVRLLTLSAAECREIASRAQSRAYDLFSPSAYVARVEGLYHELAAKGFGAR